MPFRIREEGRSMELVRFGFSQDILEVLAERVIHMLADWDINAIRGRFEDSVWLWLEFTQNGDFFLLCQILFLNDVLEELLQIDFI